MRLHRTISEDRPLLVVALEEEAAHLHVTELPLLVTGVGKVNAAISVATILAEFTPSEVVNLGTAGALREGLLGTHVVSQVIQHDLDDEAIFALSGLHFGERLDLGGPGVTLATGRRIRLARSRCGSGSHGSPISSTWRATRWPEQPWRPACPCASSSA